MDAKNRLAAWLDFYDKQGLAPASSENIGGGSFVPVRGTNPNAARMLWAENMQERERPTPPDFFADTMPPRNALSAPASPDANPYSDRVAQLLRLGQPAMPQQGYPAAWQPSLDTRRPMPPNALTQYWR